MSALRVLMVTPRFLPQAGGVETHVFEAGRRLVAAGVRVTVLTTDVSGKLPPEDEIEGVRVTRVAAHPRSKDWYVAPALVPQVTGSDADIVHVQSYHSMVAPLAMIAARRVGLRYVVTFHSGGHSSGLRSRARGAQLRTLRPLLHRASRLIAVSAFEAKQFATMLGIADGVEVVPNGAELETPDDAPAPVPGLIVSPGRLEHYKGHHRAIEALPHLLRRVPEARLRIVGSGPFEAQLHRLAAELGVADRVEIGAIAPTDRAGMASVLASAGVVAILSDYESQGISAVEAAVLRRPTVVTDATALHELVERGVAVGVAPGSSAETVATALEQQLRRPTIATAQALPTWDGCASALLDIYRDVTGDLRCAS